MDSGLERENSVKKLDGKVALVTGASRGIGRSIAIKLAENGAKVVVNYRSSADEAAEVVSYIEVAGEKAIALQGDVSDFTQAQILIKKTIDAFGSIDILVNNAGTTRDRLLMQMKEEDWDSVIETNLKSIYNCSKAAIRPMLRARSGGRIINITSVSGLTGQIGQSNYSASKAGVIGFTNALAKEVGSRMITVNAIAPGYIPSVLTQDLAQEVKDAIIQLTPLGRFGKTEDVANAALFLASDEAAFITGVTLRVDGGLAIGS
ncbi:MAG: 3-oxoacyl-[acyl-carrier-protein] reductase [Anaerolineales bacterium]|nr:3-oxoacyl-[acyl-carrier-protein] reductase [Anaerolineales bacterium]